MKVAGFTIRKPIKDSKNVTRNVYNFADSWETKEVLSKQRVMSQWALDIKNKMNTNQTKLSMKKVKIDNNVYTLLAPYEDMWGDWMNDAVLGEDFNKHKWHYRY